MICRPTYHELWTK